jgi:hypothetical protein
MVATIMGRPAEVAGGGANFNLHRFSSQIRRRAVNPHHIVMLD